MNKLTTNKSKILKLTNVLQYQCLLDEEDFDFDVAMEQMQSYIRTKGAQQIGPLIQYTKAGTEFVLNRGKPLCGKITLHFKQSHGEYLYLYNDVKEKYERIELIDEKGIELTSAGKYLLCDEKLKSHTVELKFFLPGGGLLLVVLIAVFVAVKRRYWFW